MWDVYLLTLLPWNSRCSATWDITVVDTLGNAYLQQSAITSASVAADCSCQKKGTSRHTAHSAAPTTFFQWHWKHLNP